MEKMVEMSASIIGTPAPDNSGNALEKAKQLLESGDEEMTRRIRMVKDMFNGRVIDENGDPLPV